MDYKSIKYSLETLQGLNKKALDFHEKRENLMRQNLEEQYDLAPGDEIRLSRTGWGPNPKSITGRWGPKRKYHPAIFMGFNITRFGNVTLMVSFKVNKRLSAVYTYYCVNKDKNFKIEKGRD